MKKVLGFLFLVLASCSSGVVTPEPANPVALGAPSTSSINGLGFALDPLHRVAKHALPATRVSAPDALRGLPYIPDVRLLARRDALIAYLPNVLGAADYRIYAITSAVSFQNAAPKGAVIACAGYRQYPWKRPTATAKREVLQTLELPGLRDVGQYQIVVEAISTPCPFTGMLGHSSATIPITVMPALTTATGGSVPIVGFNDVKTRYGNEILNGQGSSSDWVMQPGQKRGQPATASDPTVIARSVLQVTLPFPDESQNAPIIDVGPNAHFDDFKADAVATSFTANTDYQFGDQRAIQGAFGNWYFWGNGAQAATNDTPDNPKGVQVWQRHGRLYTTFGDWAQDVMSDIHFTSRQTKPLELDSSKYVHSFFRVDSSATNRRYWHWMLCGAATREELVDSSNTPLLRPILDPFFYEYGTSSITGKNPTAKHGNETDKPNHNQECLQILQLGGSFAPTTLAGALEPQQSIVAVINPKGRAQGVINLTPPGFNSFGTPAQFWKQKADGTYGGPLLEPFDQQAPLTHFDVFVRKDRAVFFVNGRQAACWDYSERPLEMTYGLPIYGNVLYHSDAEYTETHRPQDQNGWPANGAFHYMMNTPAADTRIWDAVGHSEKLEIPALFEYNASLCFRPITIEAK
jgi:hypothetical protein